MMNPLQSGMLWSKIFGYCCNLTIIITNSIQINILRKRVRKRAYEKVLLSLSVCDLITGLINSISLGLVLQLARTFNQENLATVTVVSWGFVVYYLTTVTLLHHMLNTLDRMFAVVYPLKHISWMTNRRVNQAVMTAWLLPIIAIASNGTDTIIQKLSLAELLKFTFTSLAGRLAVLVLAADVIFVTSYGIIVCFILKLKKMDQNHSHRVTQMKVLFLCLGSVVIFVLSTTPFVVTYIIPWQKPKWLDLFSISTYSLKSAANSIFFLIQNKRLGKQRRLSSSM